MKVLILGGTGFVGRHVVAELVRAGHRVRLLVRPGSEEKLSGLAEAEPAGGDILDPASLARAAAGQEAVIHLVGIIRELPRRGVTFDLLHRQATLNALAAAGAQGVRRFLHMSALGAAEDSASAYQRTKAQAEAAVRGSGLAWTIFRSSLIFGPEDLSLNLFARQIQTLPLVPVIGDGQYRLQPVAVTTVAQAFAAALTNPAAVGQAFEVTGPTAYAYDDLLRAIGRVLKTKVRLVHLPVWPVRLAARLLGRFAFFPLTEDQLDMLLAGSAADGSRLYDTLGLSPLPLEPGLAAYLR
jgi:NADH dehydrogenase